MARNRSLASYVRHLNLYGPVGLLEAAERDLSPEDYERLVKLTKAHKRPQKGGRR